LHTWIEAAMSSRLRLNVVTLRISTSCYLMAVR
jgi:hypothetical protein